MSRTVTIELSDEIYNALVAKAEESGITTENWILVTIWRQLQKRDERLRSLFGSVDLGRPFASDNDEIDADLAREYLDTQDELGS